MSGFSLKPIFPFRRNWAHNLNGEFLILIGVLFVDLGQSHNPMGDLLL